MAHVIQENSDHGRFDAHRGKAFRQGRVRVEDVRSALGTGSNFGRRPAPYWPHRAATGSFHARNAGRVTGKLSVAVLGAGNGGLALAGSLSQNGHRVALWNRSPE